MRISEFIRRYDTNISLYTLPCYVCYFHIIDNNSHDTHVCKHTGHSEYNILKLYRQVCNPTATYFDLDLNCPYAIHKQAKDISFYRSICKYGIVI